MTATEFVVRLPTYTGSLEGLVYEVGRRHLSLWEVPLRSLAEQLLLFLQQQGRAADLHRPMEWAELGARLIRWKSLALLPESEQQVAAATELRQEIEEKLRELERRQVERLRDLLVERWLARGGLLEIEPSIDAFRPEEPTLFPSLWTLRQKFQTLRQRAQQRHRTRQKIESLHRTDISIPDTMAALRKRLQAVPPGERIAAEGLLAEAGTRPHQQAVFLALLHLAQSQEVKWEQTSAAEEFWVICGTFDEPPSEDHDRSNELAVL